MAAGAVHVAVGLFLVAGAGHPVRDHRLADLVDLEAQRHQPLYRGAEDRAVAARVAVSERRRAADPGSRGPIVGPSGAESAAQVE